MTDQPNGKAFWGVLDEVEAESRGGGFWGQFQVMFGYRFFVKQDAGIAPQDAFYECDLMDKASRESALKQCRARIVELGLENTRPQFAVCFKIIADTVVNRTMDKGDVYMIFDAYRSGYEALTKPKLQEFNLIPGTYWGHVMWMTHEYEVPATATKSAEWKTEKYVPVPDAVYPTKEAMLKAANIKPADGSTPAPAAQNTSDIPEGYDPATWAMAINDFKKLSANGKTPAEIAKSYSISLLYVTRALNG